MVVSGYTVTGERAAQMRETPARPPERVLGTSGIPLVNGRPGREYEHNARLADGKWHTDVGKMLRSPAVAIGVGTAEDLMLSATFGVEAPKGASPEPQEYLREALGLEGYHPRMDETLEDVMKRCLRGPLAHGPSVHELDLYEADGRVWLWGLRYREPVSIEAWLTDERERLAGIRQRAVCVADESGRWVWHQPVIPASQLLTMHWGQTGSNFDGLSMLRPVWGEWRDREKTAQLLIAGSQRFALPTPDVMIDLDLATRLNVVGPDPAAWVKAEQAEAERWAKAYAAGERAFVVRPPWWVIDTFGANQMNGYELARVLEYYDRIILTGYLAQFLALGTDGGSYSLGKVQAGTAQQRATNVLQWVLSRFQSVVERLMAWNFANLPRREYPRVTFDGIRAKAWTERIADVVALLTSGGLSPDDTLEATFRRGLDLPEAEAKRTTFDRTRTSPLATEAGQAARRPLGAPLVDRGQAAGGAR